MLSEKWVHVRRGPAPGIMALAGLKWVLDTISPGPVKAQGGAGNCRTPRSDQRLTRRRHRPRVALPGGA